jgi:DNA-binding NarL/FixJ family response regulator
MTSPELITVVLADDHAVLRQGLRALLDAERDINVVGEAGNGDEAIELVERLRPTVVVMDLSMPGKDGITATREIVVSTPDTRVLVLTMHDDEQYLYRVLEAGGSGYVVKSSADTDLLSAIRSVARGGIFVYAPAAAHILKDYVDAAGLPKPSKKGGLSEREVDVLRLTAEGYTNQEIADKLFLSRKTVDSYRGRIMDKLHLQHRSELVRYALRKGLLRE